MQTSFSELKYAAKKRQTRRDRFLTKTEAVTLWVVLMNIIAPHYPSGGGCVGVAAVMVMSRSVDASMYFVYPTAQFGAGGS